MPLRWLIWPADHSRHFATDWSAFTPDNSSYELVSPAIAPGDTNSVFLRCRVHGHMAYADTTVFYACTGMTSHQTYEQQVAAILRELGVPASFGSDSAMPLYREATDLLSVGTDIYGREQRLAPAAASCWRAMRMAAQQQGVSLLLVSAFRSVAYQRQIWERKLKAGESVQEILSVSAPPGYSEHHTGRAIDMTAPGCAPVTEQFESTAAFAWLLANAGAFGFSMTYPRHNRYGVIYEPWHWSVSEVAASPCAA